MAIDVETSVTIARPRAEVAAFMFEPRNDTVWTSGIVACRPLTEGPLRKGSRVERVSKFLGREFAYEVEVVEADPEASVDMRVERPFPMQIRYELEDTPGGTKASIRARGEASGFFRLAGPLLASMVKKNIGKDLDLLKTHLESA